MKRGQGVSLKIQSVGKPKSSGEGEGEGFDVRRTCLQGANSSPFAFIHL